MDSSPRAPTLTGPSVPQSLSGKAFALCLGTVLVIFVGLHPLWEPIDMTRMDANILWSYAPIPLLVLAALAWERKLGWVSWMLETVRLTLVKFVVTFLFANLMWAWFTGPPQAAEGAPTAQPLAPQGARYDPVDVPAVAPAPAARAAGVTGVVRDAAGAALTDALVWVSHGVARLEFEAPVEPLLLQVDAQGIRPRCAVVQTYQPVTLRATDDAMHTAEARSADGRTLFNYPALPGADRPIMFEKALGLIELTCRAHEEHARPAHLLVVSHPFAARTDADGRFAFQGLPAGELELSCWTEADGAWSVPLTLVADETLELRMTRP